jgi:pimeloyl-ACP methyl ester carboxylesterase
VSALAEDLQPYFAMDTSYDVIIGHSLGGAVALALLPFLPREKETTVILVDPALEITDEEVEIHKDMFLKEIANVRTADEYVIGFPAWSRSDCVLRMLGLYMCTRADIEELFRVSTEVWKL